MQQVAKEIFDSYIRYALVLLSAALITAVMSSGIAGLHGVILGWSGINIYLFFLVRTASSALFSPLNDKFGIYTVLRFMFLFFILWTSAGRGINCFLWTIGTVVFLYLFWLLFLARWFYFKT